MNFYILGYKTYINIKSSQVFQMITDARLKKTWAIIKTILKRIFLSCKLEWISLFILYLIIIDSYGAHSIETYLSRPENYKQTSFYMFGLLRLPSYKETLCKRLSQLAAIVWSSFHIQKCYSLCRFNYVCLSFNYACLSFNYVCLLFSYVPL